MARLAALVALLVLGASLTGQAKTPRRSKANGPKSGRSGKEVVWETVIGTHKASWFARVAALQQDGSIVLGGEISKKTPPGSPRADQAVWVARVSAGGKELWRHIWSSRDSTLAGLAALPDGRTLACGHQVLRRDELTSEQQAALTAQQERPERAWLAELDANGKVQRERLFDSVTATARGQCQLIGLLPNGDPVMVRSHSGGYTHKSFGSLERLDGNWNAKWRLQWEVSYSGPRDVFPKAVNAIGEGRIVVAGEQNVFDPESNIWLLWSDAGGKREKEEIIKPHLGQSFSTGLRAVVLPDGGLILAGKYTSRGAGVKPLLRLVQGTESVKWPIPEGMYGLNEIAAHRDGSLSLLGREFPKGKRSGPFGLWRLDKSGAVIGQRRFPFQGKNYEFAEGMLAAPDGTLIVIGYRFVDRIISGKKKVMHYGWAAKVRAAGPPP